MSMPTPQAPFKSLKSRQINTSMASLCVDLVQKADLGLRKETIGLTDVIQFSTGQPFKNEVTAGIALAEICLGGLLDRLEFIEIPSDLQAALGAARGQVELETSEPLLACLGCQYAGWPFSVGDFFAMTSGPARLLRGKEPVLQQYGLEQTDEHAVAVMETASMPDEAALEQLATECGLPPNAVVVCLARTASLAGMIQIVARSIETAIHKLHELGFNLTQLVHGRGVAPVPPTTGDDLVALGWTNDSVLYGADVQLTFDSDDDSLESIVERVPSCSSEAFGRPFIELFRQFDGDFYKIDPLLFSPARVQLINRRTGSRFEAGGLRYDILRKSFESHA